MAANLPGQDRLICINAEVALELQSEVLPADSCIFIPLHNPAGGWRMLIKDLLSHKGNTVFTIQEKTSTLDALKTLNKKHVGSLIVIDADGKVAGILSERDILTHIQQSVQGVPVTTIMTPKDKLIISHGDDSIDYAMSIMTEKRIRHLPVFEGDDLIGLVSIGDVMKAVSKDLEFESKLLNEYISGSYTMVP